jgi:hypothetical protein
MKNFLTIILAFASVVAYAIEGMWLPHTLYQLKADDLKNAGLKISTQQIYDANAISMKDGICLFGSGCTAEVISKEGLILTNHHCGFDAIQQLSSIEKDYLENGFWSKQKSEELPCKGLSVTFIKGIEDVTSTVLEGVLDTCTENQRETIIKKNIEKIEKENIQKTGFEAVVKSFFNGNQFLKFNVQVFKDIRLVGTPPQSIGKFGADADNWMWPRHTGDFSMFRIYANNNLPAEYSEQNKPYIPNHSFKINLNDVKENDFTMVYGFPARTTQYLHSKAVEVIEKHTDPLKIKFRTQKLKIWNEEMKKNDTVNLQYAAKYSSVANGWKKWQGEILGLKRLNTVNKKIEFENKLITLEKKNNQLIQKNISKLQQLYTKLETWYIQREYFNEGALSSELITFINTFIEWEKKNEFEKNDSILSKNSKAFLNNSQRFYKDYRPAIDKKVSHINLQEVINNNAFDNEYNDSLKKILTSDITAFMEQNFTQSFFTKKENLEKCLSNFKENKSLYKNDKMYKLAKLLNQYNSKVLKPNLSKLDEELNKENRIFMQFIIANTNKKELYPDANSTLRVAFGNANGYLPKDGVQYQYYTTHKGLLEKQDNNNPDFTLPTKLKELLENKNFGDYADNDGNLRIAFCASNHTTGGNSGSPVFNANGELIGTNFDRNWEGTMSDIHYDPLQTRNIILDIHYTLFIIDVFAGAKNIINELEIIKKQ